MTSKVVIYGIKSVYLNKSKNQLIADAITTNTRIRAFTMADPTLSKNPRVAFGFGCLSGTSPSMVNIRSR